MSRLRRDAVSLILIAKAPVPGRVKTRLCPPCTPVEAARIAAASLTDTLGVVSRTPAARHVLAFDECGVAGAGERWLPTGWELVAQRGDGLGERLAAAFADVDGPALLVGMDTPQLTVELLLDGISALARDGVDAVLGPSRDGGYWSIGLRGPCAAAFDGVPMSVDETCAAQRGALRRLGMGVYEQAPLLDVDTFEDALVVAGEAPRSRFAAAVAAVGSAAGPAVASDSGLAVGSRAAIGAVAA